MQIRAITITTLLALALLAAPLTVAAPTWSGDEHIENGILTVFNPDTPTDPAATITPQPEWRLGDDDSDTIFGLITDAQRAADGTTYLLDAILSTVYEVAPDGTIRRTLGREGDGPGEFRNAVSLALLPDHNLGIVELMPSHMVVLGPDGLDRPGIDLRDGPASQGNVQRVTVVGQTLVMGLYSMKFEANTAEIGQTLGLFDLDGSLRQRLLHTSEKQSGGSVSISTGGDNDFLNNWSVGATGQVTVYRHRQDYLLEVFDADGKPLRNIRRKYKSVRRPASEIADQKAQQEDMRKRFGGDVEFEIEEMAADIEDVISRPDGRLWVLSSRGSRAAVPGQVGVFDVFDAAGHFQSQLTINADFDAEDDQYRVRGDHLYIFKEANNAPDRTFSSGGGNMMMVMSSGNSGRDDEQDDEDPKPYEVICYKLPAGF